MDRDERLFRGDPVSDDVALYALLAQARVVTGDLPQPTAELAQVLTHGLPPGRPRLSLERRLVRRLAAAGLGVKIALGATVAVAAGASAVNGFTPGRMVRDVVESYDDGATDETPSDARTPATPTPTPAQPSTGRPDGAGDPDDPAPTFAGRPSDVPSPARPTGRAEPEPPRGRPSEPGPVVTPPAGPPNDVPGRGEPGDPTPDPRPRETTHRRTTH